MKVSTGGFYKWLKGIESKRAKQRAALLKRILEIFEESRETYGSPRMHRQLKAEGYQCTRRTVEKLMREHEIQPKQKRKFKTTTDSKHNLPIAPNIVDREFDSREADEVWVSDITYVQTAQGWLYLCVFIDLYSRMVVGWSMSNSLATEFVVDALQMGIGKRGRAPIVVHSDRGVQYASGLFRAELDKYDCIQSMSRKGDCWDNAVAESFFGTIKQELIYRTTFRTRIEATMAIFEYLEIFYNKRRLHSALNYLTPEEKGQKEKKVA
jgi:putative transposase